MFEVSFDGVKADAGDECDVGIGLAHGDPLSDFAFAVGEAGTCGGGVLYLEEEAVLMAGGIGKAMKEDGPACGRAGNGKGGARLLRGDGAKLGGEPVVPGGGELRGKGEFELVEEGRSLVTVVDDFAVVVADEPWVAAANDGVGVNGV